MEQHDAGVMASDLLVDFVGRYNEFVAQSEEHEAELAITRQNLEGYKRQCADQSRLIAEIEAENAQMRPICIAAEKQANQLTAMTAERNRLKQQLEANKIAGSEMKRLKEQVKRLKEASEKAQVRADHLTKQRRELMDKVAMKERQLSQQMLTGIMDFGDEHLMIFPAPLTISIDKQKRTTQVPLLYIDGDGHARILTIDSDGEMTWPRDKVVRPSEKVQDVAQAWLHKVNIRQGGKLETGDLIAIQ
ncbi:hypothetical protein KUW19_00665 [Ferrimonas balearica]|uniref:hypothetical protein n=1 Tax=Ferrimonas balearica TaxID=44012 RepID=UPI001C94199F|nr:hypothetical protein [Ferrimonas balearica]MBY6104988.1 hypothetical protein [Ferrimonas balearica]